MIKGFRELNSNVRLNNSELYSKAVNHAEKYILSALESVNVVIYNEIGWGNTDQVIDTAKGMLQNTDLEVRHVDYYENDLDINPIRGKSFGKLLVTTCETLPVTSENIPIVIVTIMPSGAVDVMYYIKVNERQPHVPIANLFKEYKAVFAVDTTIANIKQKQPRNYVSNKSAMCICKTADVDILSEFNKGNLQMRRLQLVQNLELLEEEGLELIVNIVDSRGRPDSIWTDFRPDYYSTEDNYLVNMPL